MIIPAENKQLRDRFRVLLSNYPFAVKEHLREGIIREELEENPEIDLDRLIGQGHVPNAIAQRIYLEMQGMRSRGEISETQLITLDTEFISLTDVIGACERIKKTPIPYAYNSFLKKTIFIYVLSLPFGVVHDLGYYTIFLVPFIFYILSSLELIAEEIEDPFGRDPNDLPTDSLAKGIRKSMTELFQ